VVFDRKFGGLLTNFDRITQPVTDFIRGNPIVSTAAIGIGTTGLLASAITAVRRRKKKGKVKKRKTTRRKNGRKRVRKTKKGRRRIIRGRGLGRGEIKHSGRGTKGTKVVSFMAKGKRVTFKIKGTSKRRKGFRR